MFVVGLDHANGSRKIQSFQISSSLVKFPRGFLYHKKSTFFQLHTSLNVTDSILITGESELSVLFKGTVLRAH